MLHRAVWLSVFLIACSEGYASSKPEGELVPVPPMDGGGQEDAGADPDSGGKAPVVGPACGAAPYRKTDACPHAIGEQHCSEGAAHRPAGSAIDWQSNPPHSGPHYRAWADWGVSPDRVARGTWVHNLEHGGIVLLYDCESDCEQDVELLEAVVRQRPAARILLTADSKLEDSRFAAVSWTWTYETDELDVDALLCFIDQHERNAPEDVP